MTFQPLPTPALFRTDTVCGLQRVSAPGAGVVPEGALTQLVFGRREGHRLTTRWSAHDAVVLKPLDNTIPPGGADARYLDDGVILTRTCRQILEMKERQVVKNMHAIVHGLKPRLALAKTFIGQISKGFDFLGDRFGAMGLIGLAPQTNDKHPKRILLRPVRHSMLTAGFRVNEYWPYLQLPGRACLTGVQSGWLCNTPGASTGSPGVRTHNLGCCPVEVAQRARAALV